MKGEKGLLSLSLPHPRAAAPIAQPGLFQEWGLGPPGPGGLQGAEMRSAFPEGGASKEEGQGFRTD